MPPKIFFGSAANHLHTQQIALALEESGQLECFATPSFGDGLLKLAGIFSNATRARLEQRRPPGVAKNKLREVSFWETLRLAAAHAKAPASWIDTIWEREEHHFARWCAARIKNVRPSVYLGTEHGALEALNEAQTAGVPGGLIFTSLHHAFRERWLKPELVRFPELASRDNKIRSRDARRDERRDRELRVAKFVHANSSLTEQSLVEAGVPREHILTIPLGCPTPISPQEIDPTPLVTPVVLFAGNVAIHKGAHYLLDAWRRLQPGTNARLELLGQCALPEVCLEKIDSSVIFHGSFPRHRVREIMMKSSVLVLPSICDGFGMVVSEALSVGLPVICSNNAGASQLIAHGINGWTVPAANTDALATAIDWCLTHPHELAKMRPAAADTARNWSWTDFRREFAQKLGRYIDNSSS